MAGDLQDPKMVRGVVAQIIQNMFVCLDHGEPGMQAFVLKFVNHISYWN